MLGAIAGDIIGSTREWSKVASFDFELFEDGAAATDDSILTLAVAEWLIDGTDLVSAFKDAVQNNPDAGWGRRFRVWGWSDDPEPYNSYGNGAAMRVSPVGFAASSIDEVLDLARWTAEVTHNHPEGIKGAQAIALAIFLARQGSTKGEIRSEMETRFDYDLSRSYDEVRKSHTFRAICQISVPAALTAFLESTDYEDAIRRAVWLRGDADTEASIAGGIAHAFFGSVPWDVREQTIARLEPEMRSVLKRFEAKYGFA